VVSVVAGKFIFDIETDKDKPIVSDVRMGSEYIV